MLSRGQRRLRAGYLVWAPVADRTLLKMQEGECTQGGGKQRKLMSESRPRGHVFKCCQIALKLWPVSFVSILGESYTQKVSYLNVHLDFSGGSVVGNLVNAGDMGLIPRLGRPPLATRLTYPQLLTPCTELCACNQRGHHDEKPTQPSQKVSSLSAQQEKACTQE